MTAPNKDSVIVEAEGYVLKQQKLYDRGIITGQERYNKVIDIWTHAREQITDSMKHELEHDLREGRFVCESDLSYGGFRRSWRYRADSTARRDAGPDGQAVG